MIVMNKDELTVPLMLEQLPTPKEFADAVASLSAEQRRFCQAYRQLQARRPYTLLISRPRALPPPTVHTL